MPGVPGKPVRGRSNTTRRITIPKTRNLRNPLKPRGTPSPKIFDSGKSNVEGFKRLEKDFTATRIRVDLLQNNPPSLKKDPKTPLASGTNPKAKNIPITQYKGIQVTSLRKGDAALVVGGSAVKLPFHRKYNLDVPLGEGKGYLHLHSLGKGRYRLAYSGSETVRILTKEGEVKQVKNTEANKKRNYVSLKGGDQILLGEKRVPFLTRADLVQGVRFLNKVRRVRIRIAEQEGKIDKLEKEIKSDPKTKLEKQKELRAEKEILELNKKFLGELLAKNQRTLDGTPYAEIMPGVVRAVSDQIFDAKGPVDRKALRDQVFLDLVDGMGIKLSTDNVKAIDSIIDLTFTAKKYGVFGVKGGLSRTQFNQLVGELFLFQNPKLRIGGTELTHVPMVVEGTLAHYEAIMKQRGESSTVAGRKMAFLMALFHDAGKWDPTIKTKTGFTILKSSFFNKTGQDIVIKPGKSLAETLAEQKIDPAKVPLPFSGFDAILVHHDALTVRDGIKQLVALGILSPLEGQRAWMGIQYHGFVSSWIVNNSLAGIGIKI